VESVLPVNILPYDDRVEVPEGAVPEVTDTHHPIVAGIVEPWPYLLGFNEIEMKPDAQLLVKINQFPLLAVKKYGKGRTLAGHPISDRTGALRDLRLGVVTRVYGSRRCNGLQIRDDRQPHIGGEL
jgi:uncharacterized membrane protein